VVRRSLQSACTASLAAVDAGESGPPGRTRWDGYGRRVDAIAHLPTGGPSILNSRAAGG